MRCFQVKKCYWFKRDLMQVILSIFQDTCLHPWKSRLSYSFTCVLPVIHLSQHKGRWYTSLFNFPHLKTLFHFLILQMQWDLWGISSPGICPPLPISLFFAHSLSLASPALPKCFPSCCLLFALSHFVHQGWNLSNASLYSLRYFPHPAAQAGLECPGPPREALGGDTCCLKPSA